MLEQNLKDLLDKVTELAKTDEHQAEELQSICVLLESLNERIKPGPEDFGPWTVETFQEHLEKTGTDKAKQLDVIDLCLVNLHLAEEAERVTGYTCQTTFKLKTTLYSLMNQSMTGTDGSVLAAQLQSFLETE